MLEWSVSVLAGASVSFALIYLGWQWLRSAAAPDLHRHIQGSIPPVPSKAIRPAVVPTVRKHRQAIIVRQRHGTLPARVPAARRAGERDLLLRASRDRRLVDAGGRFWMTAVALPLAFGGYFAFIGNELLDWNSAVPEPWGEESLGAALGCMVSGFYIRATNSHVFGRWNDAQPPHLRCLDALLSCRAFDRPATGTLSETDERVDEFCTALKRFARVGHSAGDERREELLVHATAVSAALHSTMGKVLRREPGSEAEAVRLLSTVQDRLFEGRWLQLLDASDLPAPSPAPTGPTPAGAATEAAARGWNWVAAHAGQALSGVAALGTLALAPVVIIQSDRANDINATQQSQAEREAARARADKAVRDMGDSSVSNKRAGIAVARDVIENDPDNRDRVMGALKDLVHEEPLLKESERAARPYSAYIVPALKVLTATSGWVADEDGSYGAVDLQGLSLPGLRLSKFDPTFDLEGCGLDGLIANDMDWTGSNLAGCRLTGSRLTRVDLSGVPLDGAKLQKATLTDVQLCDASLEGADLRGATLKGVTYDTETKWPKGYGVPRSAKKVETCE